MKRKTDKRTNRLMVALTIAAAVVVLLLVIGGSLFRQNIWKQAAAYQVGGETYSVAEVEWYYYMAYHSIVENASGYTEMLGLDTDISLSEQQCPLSEEGKSWRDYLLGRALQEISDVSAKYQEAQSKGNVDETVIQNNTESALEYWRMTASEAGYASLDQYLREVHGGIQEAGLRKILEQEYTAQFFEEEYMAGFAPAEEELYNYFEVHREEFRTYSYLYGYMGTDRAAAEEVCKASNEQEFRNMVQDLTGTECYELLNMTASELGNDESKDWEWLSDPDRQEGDTWCGQSGENYYVLWFLGSDDGEEDWGAYAREGLQEEYLKDWNDALAEKYVSQDRFWIRFAGK